mmetsp:Transcript_88216/g.139421  ORF Transcript_88216/g.139421 Transcript_88216/m.139421 type:complete len:225 (+) Transcript_88216:71-745(+)
MAHGARFAIQVVLHLLGIIVNGAMLFQAAVLLSEPRLEGLTEFCRWVSQGALFTLLGSVGMTFEFWSYCKAPKGVLTMVARRTMLGFYYFWLGCCAFGDIRSSVSSTMSVPQNQAWELVDSTIGIQLVECAIGACAWGAAALNVLTSCCVEKFEDEDDEEKVALVDSKITWLPDGASSSEVYSKILQHQKGSFQTKDAPSNDHYSSGLEAPPTWNSCAKPFGSV